MQITIQKIYILNKFPMENLRTNNQGFKDCVKNHIIKKKSMKFFVGLCHYIFIYNYQPHFGQDLLL